MRWMIWIWLAMAGVSLGAPAEMPPETYARPQYIDSAGCVFSKNGSDWAARLDRNGAAICGFPPSLSARRVDPGTDSVLVSTNPLRPPTVEEMIAATLAEGLRDGELRADPTPREQRRDIAVPSPRSGPMADLAAIVAATPAIEHQISAGLRPNDRLCALLGYSAEGMAPQLGGDATDGFCPGGNSDPLAMMVALLPSLQMVGGAQMGAETSSDNLDESGAAAKSTEPEKRDAMAPASQQQPTRTAQTDDEAKARHRVIASDAMTEEMISPGARFVQIGDYPNPHSQDAAIRVLSALGYRVVRGTNGMDRQDGGIVLAGPFKDRRSLVAALNDLRTRGIGRPVPR